MHLVAVGQGLPTPENLQKLRYRTDNPLRRSDHQKLTTTHIWLLKLINPSSLCCELLCLFLKIQRYYHGWRWDISGCKGEDRSSRSLDDGEYQTSQTFEEILFRRQFLTFGQFLWNLALPHVMASVSQSFSGFYDWLPWQNRTVNSDQVNLFFQFFLGIDWPHLK